MIELTINPLNSIVFLFDRLTKNVAIPEYFKKNIIGSTDSCISIGTLNESDGETTIKIITTEDIENQTVLEWTFFSEFNTPSKKLSLVASDNTELATILTKSNKTRVSIGINDLSEPDLIIIAID